MIAKMKRLTLVCVDSERDRTLVLLRDFGFVELDLSKASGAEFAAGRADLEKAERAVRIALKAAEEKKKATGSVGLDFDCPRMQLVDEILKLDAQRTEAEAEALSLEGVIRTYEPFGDFDPALAEKVEKETGLATTLVKTTLRDADFGDAHVVELGRSGKTRYLAVVGVRPSPAPGLDVVPAPKEPLCETNRRLTEALAKVARLEDSLAAAGTRADQIEAMFPGLKDRIDFAAADEALSKEGKVAWIQGWIPADRVPSLRAKAVTESWGLDLRDPEPGEEPPVLITPPKLFRPVRALFEALGIAPAYNETDVSVPFMCYFSVFFAMLVGDGGYGALILAATLFGWWKTRPTEGHRPAPVRSWLTLLTVFSVATVIWGVLSNTWFGAGLPFAAEWPTVKWLGDPSYHNMMFLCFTIGVSHLMVARIWSGVCRINDSTCLAEFGWAGILLFMYFVTNSIVGIMPAIPKFMFPVFYVSIALVFLFTVKPSQLKTRGAELGMLPLNIMSALGDIISYVRLFAVGLASVKVAQNFNDMATGLLSSDNSWWLNALMAVGTVLILLVGHALNFAMAGLSILVHAVRLNTLEFSNHKGVTWSGSAFRPFRKH